MTSPCANGTTTLSGTATIDMMTVEGPAKLNIAAGGTLNTWADYTQVSGWSQVDGALNISETCWSTTGILSGTGVINSRLPDGRWRVGRARRQRVGQSALSRVI